MSLNFEAASAGGPARAPLSTERFCVVVDDDPGIRKALSFTLRKAGVDVADAATVEALDAIVTERTPDLIFLDLGLGRSGVMDVLPILDRHNYRGAIQLMSGRSRSVLDEVAAAGSELGLRMLPALAKPFRMSVVKDIVAGLA